MNSLARARLSRSSIFSRISCSFVSLRHVAKKWKKRGVMACVSVTNVAVLDNPARFNSKFQTPSGQQIMFNYTSINNPTTPQHRAKGGVRGRKGVALSVDEDDEDGEASPLLEYKAYDNVFTMPSVPSLSLPKKSQ